jgi:hypothetical protein
MVDVQIGMMETGRVQASQSSSQLACDAPPAPCISFPSQDYSQLHPRRFPDQQESAAPIILARRQPLRTGKAFTLERLQHPRLAQAAR